MNLTQRLAAGAVLAVAVLAPAASAAPVPACSVETTSPVVVLLSNPPQFRIQGPPYVTVDCS